MFVCDRSIVKRLVGALLYLTGVLWFWRFLHRHDVTILMAHGVMDTEQPTSWIPLRPQLSRRTLDDTLRRLSRYYRFVSLEDAVAMLAGRSPLQLYSMVLTFDDGYRNNFSHALPILRRHQVPASFFVTTGNIEERRPFWFDRLDYALQHAAVDGRQVKIGKKIISLEARNRDSLQLSYKRFRDAAKGAVRPDHEMVHELEGLAAELEDESRKKIADVFADDDWSALPTWQELKDSLGSDVTVGSHTVDHVRLALVDDKVCTEQLLRSKQTIEQRLGQPCRYLCYPGGSFTEQVAALARECGYEAAVSTEEGLNSLGQDVMSLRRLPFPETGNSIMTLVHVCGLSFVVSQWRDRLRELLRRRLRPEAALHDEQNRTPAWLLRVSRYKERVSWTND